MDTILLCLYNTFQKPDKSYPALSSSNPRSLQRSRRRVCNLQKKATHPRMELQQTNINRIHRLASQTGKWSALPEQNALAVGEYLQKIQGLLDVRDDDHLRTGRTSKKKRSQRPCQDVWKKSSYNETTTFESSATCQDLDSLTRDLRQRRDECRHINRLFMDKCETFQREARALRSGMQAL